MDREFKFRAYDPSTNKMFIPDVVTGHTGSVYETGRDYEDGIRADGCPLMQYTGLKDKNEVEIYEGDVIRIKQGECIGTSADGEEEWIEIIGQVLFEDAMFVFDGHSAGTLPLSAYKDDLEIIGNIYQNPELLKQ
jgi:uncharacterized phage protein (TIGR01671 family)